MIVVWYRMCWWKHVKYRKWVDNVRIWFRWAVQLWAMVSVKARPWCYACQILILQNNNNIKEVTPRFPYKPWKCRRPRSYNKVKFLIEKKSKITKIFIFHCTYWPWLVSIEGYFHSVLHEKIDSHFWVKPKIRLEGQRFVEEFIYILNWWKQKWYKSSFKLFPPDEK